MLFKLSVTETKYFRISIDEDESVILLQFHRFQSMVTRLLALGPVARQCILVGVSGGESCSPHCDQEAERDRKCQNPHAPPRAHPK